MTDHSLSQSRLGRWVDLQVQRAGGRSGFGLLHNGLDAFVARAALIEVAERTLDLQYYIFHADTTGSIIVDRLFAAADRGVRVRILLDDWGTIEKNEAAVARVDAHPNIDIRLFNPYVNRSGLRRLAELFTRFARINRRMHNKQLIADGHAVVLGGRNIGDEYFGIGEFDFQDIDILGVGPIAAESARSFETYWNSEFAVPVSALGKYDIAAPALNAQRDILHERFERFRDTPYALALRESRLANALRSQAVELHWADAKLLSDPPDKLRKPAGATSETYLGAQFTPYADAVRSELLVVSAYFVPGKKGIEFFGGKGRTGTAIRILTNSLAATDVWLVHASYKKYRRPLLEAGVRLYELKAEAQGGAGVKGLIGSSRSSLHGKTFVLDRRKVFVGSVNIDPRSLAQNTEVGVLVDSPALAAEVAALFERWADPSVAYEVVLTGERRTQLGWIGSTNGKQVQLTSEPDARFWRRLGANVFAMLPIESLV